MKKKEISVAFLGTPRFGTLILEALAEVFHVGLVVTAPDDARKGPSPVSFSARSLGLSASMPETIAPSVFAHAVFDLFVIAAYGKILPKNVLAIPKHGVLNIHPSLLPKYRGASPVQAAILAGAEESGITIILTDEKMDHGPILRQEKTAIEPRETSVSLTEKLSHMGARLIIPAISDYLAGTLVLREQDHAKASFSKLLTREDGKIDWNAPAETIERAVRAYLLWPTAWSYFRSNVKTVRVRILASMLGNEKNHASKPGSVEIKNGDLAVAASDKYLRIQELQPEGKNRMSGKEFVRGYVKGPDSSFLSDI